MSKRKLRKQLLEAAKLLQHKPGKDFWGSVHHERREAYSCLAVERTVGKRRKVYFADMMGFSTSNATVFGFAAYNEETQLVRQLMVLMYREMVALEGQYDL